MSAAEKLKALAEEPVRNMFKLGDALPQIVAVVEAAEKTGYELHVNGMHFHERAMADPFEAEAYVQEEGAKLLRALAALDEALP